jgi:ATP-dependent helicase/nuclease subunit B
MTSRWLHVFAHSSQRDAYANAQTAASGCCDRTFLLTLDEWDQHATADRGAQFVSNFDGVCFHHLIEWNRWRVELVCDLAKAMQGTQSKVLIAWPSFGDEMADAYVVWSVEQFERQTTLDTLELEQQVFESPFYRMRAGAGSPTTTGIPRLLALPTVVDESIHVARSISQHVHAGVPAQQMAIVVSDEAQYAAPVVDALLAFELAPRFGDGFRLSHTTIFRALSLLFSLPAQQFSAPALARFFAWSGLPAFAAVSTTAARVFRGAGVSNNVRGAATDAGALSEGLLAFEQRLATRVPARASEVAALRRATQAVIDTVKTIAKASKVGTQVSLLHQALVAWSRADETSQHPTDARDKRTLAVEFNRQLQQRSTALLTRRLVTAAESAAALDSHQSLDGLQQLIESVGENNTVPLPLVPFPSIEVLSPRETVGRSFGHVFWIGCSQAAMRPAKLSVQPVFEAQHTDAIPKPGRPASLRVSSGFVDAEDSKMRLMVASVCASAKQSLTISWAEALGGEQTEPAPMVNALSNQGVVIERPSTHPPWPLSIVGREDELRTTAVFERSRHAGLQSSLFDELWSQHVTANTFVTEERNTYYSVPGIAAGKHSGRVSAALAKQLLPADQRAPLSASQLSSFGACGFRGFAGTLLRLQETEAAGAEVSPRLRGTLLHRVAALAVETLRASRSFSALSRQAIDDAVLAASEQVVASFETEHPTGLFSLWQLEIERTRERVSRMLELQVPLFATAVPAFEELSFGPQGDRPVILPAVFPGESPIALRGVIDRLDVGPNRVRVIDYKSSVGTFTGNIERLLLTSEYQLPLYLYAAQQLFKEKTLSAYWVSLADGSMVDLQAALPGDPGFKTLVGSDDQTRSAAAAQGQPNFANAVHALVGRLQSGYFEARPLNQACETCAYSSVCRIPAQAAVEPLFS